VPSLRLRRWTPDRVPAASTESVYGLLSLVFLVGNDHRLDGARHLRAIGLNDMLERHGPIRLTRALSPCSLWLRAK
jgi:hypothetical protein